jgi:hypothetical protein
MTRLWYAPEQLTPLARQATAAGRPIEYAHFHLPTRKTAMFEDERRRQQQERREKAERYAVIVAMINRNAAAAQRAQQQLAHQRANAAARKVA